MEHETNVTVHVIREATGRGIWWVVWLDEAGRCIERRCFSRTTRGRLFFGNRFVTRFAPGGAALASTVWVWDRYGRIERTETDFVRGSHRRLAWRGLRDRIGQIVGQFVSAPRKPDPALLTVPMGDEPRPPMDAFVFELDPSERLADERCRQEDLAEARRCDFDEDTMYVLQSVLTGGPLLKKKTQLDVLAFLIARADAQSSADGPRGHDPESDRGSG